MDRRQAARLLLALPVAALLAGCGGSSTAPTETGLKPDAETEAADESMQNYAKKQGTRKGAR